MGDLECLGDLARNRQSLVHSQGALGNALGERGPLNELHHQRATAAGFLETVDLRNMRMIERGEYTRFAAEAGNAIRIGHEGVAQNFERHFALELRVLGAIDLAHASCAERPDDFIRPESRSRRYSHVRMMGGAEYSTAPVRRRSPGAEAAQPAELPHDRTMVPS
jgi:hypothetical protein